MPRQAVLSKKGINPDAKRLATLIASVTGAAGPHAVLSATHSDTATTAATQGDLIVADNTPQWDVLTVGAANSVLVSDGTDPSWDTTPTVVGLTVNGNIAVTGTVDGVDVAAFNAAQFVMIAASDETANERVLTAGDGIDLTDAGAGAAATLAVDVTDILGTGLDEDGANNIVLPTPGTLTVATGNAEAAPHTHAITSSSNPGAAASLLATDADGDVSIQDLTIAEFIIHAGDADTYIQAQDDRWDHYAGNIRLLQLRESAGGGFVTVNEDGADVDFRVEAVGIGDAFQVLGSDGEITMGALGPGIVQADVNGVLSSDFDIGSTTTFQAGIILDDGIGDSPMLQFIGGSNELATLYFDDTARALVITIEDNQAIAYSILDDGAGDLYMQIVTTTGSEEVVFNNGGDDVDFRVKAVGYPDAFQIFGSNGVPKFGRFGIGLVQADAGGSMASDTYVSFGLTFGAAVEFNVNEVDVDFEVNSDIGTAFFLQGSDGKIGLGTGVIPHGGIGAAMLALEGTNISVAAGPHIQATTAIDDYPLLQILNWTHDSIHIAFDAYYDLSWRSSDPGSNFHLVKDTDQLRIEYDSGIAAGDVVTWNTGITLDTAGNIGIGTSAPNSLMEWNFTTENLEFVNAGSAGATEQGWIEVELAGVQGFIRVYAAI